jgi:hypothetical protein
LGALAALVAGAAAHELRTWTDSTGRHRVRARFVELSDGKVTLERENGKQLVIPLEKLSEEDQKVAAEAQSASDNPFQEKPAEKKGKHKAEEQPEDEDSSESAEPKELRPQWSDARQVLINVADSKWSLSIAAPEKASAEKGHAVVYPGKTGGFWDHTKAFLVNPVCRRAVVANAIEAPMQQDHSVRVALCDLAEGRLLSTGTIETKMLPLALNDAGTEIVARRDDWGWGNQDCLEVWRLGKSKIRRVSKWKPHEDQRGGGRDIRWAQYIDADRLATLSGGDKLTVWNVADARPLYWLKVHGGSTPALSADRKYLAFASDNAIAVLDLGAGEVVAAEPAPKEHFAPGLFAFTPRGTRLVCGSGDRIFVWDAATGALYREIPLAGANVNVGESLLCPSEDQLLVGKTLLVDIESQARVWSYQGHENVRLLNGVCWFEVAGQDSGAILPAVLPAPGMMETLQKALDAPDFFVLKTGVTVKLDCSAVEDPGEREKVVTGLTQKLQANGCQVGDGGTIELLASTEKGRQTEIAYRTWGFPGARRYPFQEYLCHVKFVYQGQTAWEASCGNTPGFVRLQEGETMEEFLKRNEHPNYAWFGMVDLPKLLQKPSDSGGTLGATKVTTAGME